MKDSKYISQIKLNKKKPTSSNPNFIWIIMKYKKTKLKGLNDRVTLPVWWNLFGQRRRHLRQQLLAIQVSTINYPLDFSNSMEDADVKITF